MDAEHLDNLLRSLTLTAPRRSVVAALAGALLAIAPVELGGHVLAEKKRKRRKRKKRRSQALSPPPPPLPQGPTTTADASCLDATHADGTVQRVAQTFRALRSGQLTSASVVLALNAEGADFVMEIRAVDQVGTPSSVLSSASIANVPQTIFGETRTIPGSFSTPANVVAGQRYALSLTETPHLGYAVQLSESGSCSDGNLFVDDAANGTFVSSPGFDLVFATYVTA